VPARPRCLPVGIRNTFSRSTGFSGNRILPAATTSSSSSVPSLGEKGTSLATGRLRSRMMISSPPLAKDKIFAQSVLEFCNINASHEGHLRHGYYSYDCGCRKPVYFFEVPTSFVYPESGLSRSVSDAIPVWRSVLLFFMGSGE